MAEDKNNKSFKKIGLILAGITCIFLALVIAIFTAGISSTNTVEIAGSKNIDGVRCINIEKMNYIFEEATPVSHKNTITAVFIDGGLSSLSLEYKGEYIDAIVADHARDLAEARYNLTMTEQYGLDIADYSRNISVSSNVVHATITATSDKNLNSKTASLFMLDNVHNFPNSLQDIKTAYESAGFTCSINN